MRQLSQGESTTDQIPVGEILCVYGPAEGGEGYLTLTCGAAGLHDGLRMPLHRGTNVGPFDEVVTYRLEAVVGEYSAYLTAALGFENGRNLRLEIGANLGLSGDQLRAFADRRA